MNELLDNAPCGFLLLSRDGHILEANAGISAMLHYPVDELKGRKFESLLNIAGRIFCQTHLFPLLALHGKADEIFLTFHAADRSEVPVLLNIRTRVVDGIAEDYCILMPVYQRQEYETALIRARKDAEEALSRNELLKAALSDLEVSKINLDQQLSRSAMIHGDLAKFSKVISHDMREPIRKILMFSDIIQRENGQTLPPGSRRAVDRIQASAKRMSDLITSLQQYVSIEAGDQAMPCDLNGIVGIAKRNAIIAFTEDILNVRAMDLPIVEGYPEQLVLLFYHLIINAAQHRQEGQPADILIESGIIQQNIYTRTENKYRYVDFAMIRFSDKGKGFDTVYADYVFQMFKKEDPETLGLGFGLALCKKIVEVHYGSISAISEKGKGASFTILLPLKHH